MISDHDLVLVLSITRNQAAGSQVNKPHDPIQGAKDKGECDESDTRYFFASDIDGLEHVPLKTCGSHGYKIEGVVGR